MTNYRQKVLTADSLALIKTACESVASKMCFQVLEFNGEPEHVHMLIEYPPKLAISQMVNAMKGVSSRRYGQAGLPKPQGKTSLWSPSHFAVSVGGAPIEVLKQYIKDQKGAP